MENLRNHVWLVDSRYRIQKSLLALNDFLEKHYTTLEHDRTSRGWFSLLVGVGFSLWRAAFLEDRTRKVPNILSGEQKLLKRVIRDNSISYLQDRETRDWMGGYYLNNARYRLIRLREKLALNVDDHSEVVEALTKIENSGYIDDTDPREAWDAMHDALVALFQLLKRQLEQ